MTEKTALYQDGKLISYCDEISLKTEFDNTHFAITGFSPTDHQPAFAVGEYYKVCTTTKLTYKVTPNDITEKQETKFYVDYEDRFVKMNLHKEAIERDTPATAEQIATFKRAEHFSSKGRKLDEFHVGDKVSIVGTDEIVKIDSLRGDSSFGGVSDLGNYFIISTPSYYGVTLIQTAEELQEKPHLQAAAPPGYVRQPRKE